MQFRRALQIVVDGQLQVSAGNRMLRAQDAHFAAVAVDDHILRAVLAAQQLVVGLLDAGFAHHVARLVGGIARIVQVFFADLTDVADQMRCVAVTGIEAPLFFERVEFGQLVLVRLDEGDFVGRHVLLDGDGLVAGLETIVAQRGAKLVEVEVQAFGDQRQVGVDVVALLANEEAGGRRIVVDDQAALAIEELAARCHHGNFADAVLLCQHAEAVRAQHLQAPQAGDERQHHEQNSPLDCYQLDVGDLLASIIAVVGEHGGTESG